MNCDNKSMIKLEQRFQNAQVNSCFEKSDGKVTILPFSLLFQFH